jgi:hypothetical protein
MGKDTDFTTGLGVAGNAVYRALVTRYSLSDDADLALAALAGRCVDAARHAATALAATGTSTADTRGGIKGHPLVAVERDARMHYMAALRLLHDLRGQRAGGEPNAP